jgi:excisionase family DNA binding protein
MTIYRLVESGDLSAVTIGRTIRVRAADVEKLLIPPVAG